MHQTRNERESLEPSGQERVDLSRCATDSVRPKAAVGRRR